MRHALRAAALLAAVAVSGCGGGSHTLPAATATSAPSTSGGTGAATLSLLIPSAAYAAAHGRKTQYVSPSTLSGQLVISGGMTYELDLSSSSPLCTTATNGRTCLISVRAPVGADMFSLTLYDGAFTGGVHTGTALSAAANFAATITEGSANTTLPMILGGIVASAQIVVTSEPAAYTTSGSGAFGTAVLEAYDADGNLIVGPGGYVTSSGSTLSFVIGTTPQNEQISINGGSYGITGTVTAPSDTIAFQQTSVSIGARFTVTPSSAVTVRAQAYVRPSGFTTTDVESADLAVSATGLQLTPAAGNASGVAYVGVGSSISGVTNAAVANSGATCTSFLGRVPDFGYSGSTLWQTDSTPTLWSISATCDRYPQSPVGTVATMIADTDGTTTLSVDTNCTGISFVPGVYFNTGTAAPNCTLPHDAVNDGQNIMAVPYTNSTDSYDHLALYSGTSFVADVALAYSGHHPAGETIISAAGGGSAYDLFEANGSTRNLWVVAHTPGTSTASVSTLIPLPAAYSYVTHTNVSGALSWSNRTIALGADGLLYMLVSSPTPGLLVIDPSSGSVVTQIPNVAAVSGAAPYNVVADARGTIYWSANGYLMHYPNNIP